MSIASSKSSHRNGFCLQCDKPFGDIYGHIKRTGHTRRTSPNMSAKDDADLASESNSIESSASRQFRPPSPAITINDFPAELRNKYHTTECLRQIASGHFLTVHAHPYEEDEHERYYIEITRDFLPIASVFHQAGELLEPTPNRFKEDPMALEAKQRCSIIQESKESVMTSLVSCRKEKLELRSKVDEADALKSHYQEEVDAMKLRHQQELDSLKCRHQQELAPYVAVTNRIAELDSLISNLEEQLKIAELEIKQSQSVIRRSTLAGSVATSSAEYYSERSRLEHYGREYLVHVSNIACANDLFKPIAERLAKAVQSLESIRFDEVDKRWFEVYHKAHRVITSLVYCEIEQTIPLEKFDKWYDRFFK